MERAYYIPRGAPIKIVVFFYLKNFHRQFRLCEILAVARGQVCSGPAKPAGVGLRACLRIVDIYFDEISFSFVFGFSLVFLRLFFVLYLQM